MVITVIIGTSCLSENVLLRGIVCAGPLFIKLLWVLVRVSTSIVVVQVLYDLNMLQE